MNHLHCTACKFTLLCAPEEVAGYKANPPVHCGQPMIPDGGDPVHDAPTSPGMPAPAPEVVDVPKPKKGGKKKK